MVRAFSEGDPGRSGILRLGTNLLLSPGSLEYPKDCGHQRGYKATHAQKEENHSGPLPGNARSARNNAHAVLEASSCLKGRRHAGRPSTSQQNQPDDHCKAGPDSVTLHQPIHIGALAG